MALNPWTDPLPSSLARQRAATESNLSALWSGVQTAATGPVASNRTPRTGAAHPGTSSEVARADHTHGAGGGPGGDGTATIVIEQLQMFDFSTSSAAGSIAGWIDPLAPCSISAGQVKNIPGGSLNPSFVSARTVGFVNVIGYYRNGMDHEVKLIGQWDGSTETSVYYLAPTGSSLASFSVLRATRIGAGDGHANFVLSLSDA